MNHDPGTSIFSIGSSAAARWPRKLVSVLNARATAFQFMKNRSSPEVTIMGTPIHSDHDEILRKLGASMTPARRKCGASST